MKNSRIRLLNSKNYLQDGRCVVYWMSRDQRVDDNWALVAAQNLAEKYRVALEVCFVLSPTFLEATARQYEFMLQGLKEVQEKLHKLQIPFFLLYDEEGEEDVVTAVCKFAKQRQPVALVTDFSVLKIGREWREKVSENVDCRMMEVDAHNIVPAWLISEKQEFGAYTLRPKMSRMIDEYLEDCPKIRGQTRDLDKYPAQINVEATVKNLNINKSVLPVDWIRPGEKAALEVLDKFVHEKLGEYDQYRNDPNFDAQSNLSAYLHFGQISAQRVAMVVMAKSKQRLRSKLSEAKGSAEKFLEELIVRRELADNYSFYNRNYDNWDGAPKWARESLDEHRSDDRQYLYSLEELERGKTHEKLWNAAQLQMVSSGKMHGYLRMYWAKKILEWTQTPEQAIEVAIYLNDKYELDGRDPNGYTGVMWAITGVHDRPWFERPIFGKIRYMSESGARNKFSVDEYVQSIFQGRLLE
jgi:deoxyribodipyrimidine photo-lyase